LERLGTFYKTRKSIAMLSPEENSRYAKQIILPEFKAEGQEKLRAAKVLVIGAGGLGCPVLQYLAAAGVGTIGIADGDTVSVSNLQRQVLYTEEEIGESKTKVAARKLNALNPHVRLELYPVFIDSENALEILRYYDVIVDGSDNFATRYLINDACVILNKPLVSGAIYKFEGQVAVLNYKDGPTYRCLFPEPPADGESPNCADIGVIATLPGIIGAIQANEVIKIITGIGEVLSGKLLVMDTLTMQTHTFIFKLNKANKKITKLTQSLRPCEVVIDAIEYADLAKMIQEDVTIQLVDVREQEEHAIANIGGINISLSRFDAHADILNRDHQVVLYCASGVRSNKAAKILLQKGFLKVSNLKGGMGHLTGS
jgi:molybdopterin/thiamine biosynthesis adenylyltransferase/rhodanese-related sulfurtransferase